MSDFEQPVQPMSRAEAILRKYGDVTPMSRVEDLLKELVDESGGSDVTVTPVLSDGVRLATIGVDGTDYNIYAPEDVVGSIVSVTTEYNTGTLLATITVNDVDHYIYVPEANNILSGTNTPSANVGEDNDIFIKYDGVDTESTYTQLDSFSIGRFVYDATRTVDLSPNYYHIKFTMGGGNDYVEKIVLKTDIYPTGSVYLGNSNNTATFTINGNTITVSKTGVPATGFTISASTILDSTPTGINTPYAKLKGTWFPFPDNEGTEVIANPEGTATDTLTKLSVDGDVYEIPDSGSTNSYGYNNPSDSDGANGDIYCKISDISGQDECIESTITLPTSTWTTVPLLKDANVYTTLTISGISNDYSYSYTYDVNSIGDSSSTATTFYITVQSGKISAGTMYKSGASIVMKKTSGAATSISSLVGTYTDAHAVNDIYQKVEGSWARYEDETGSEVIANPEDTPTETLTSISVNGVTYRLPSGSSYPTAGVTSSVSGEGV